MVTLKERFEKYVGKTAGCWEWTGHRERSGYGRLFVSGAPERAHRISFRLHKGIVPDGMCVCHTCDNRSCVNPVHLFLGTRADNNADMRLKGRARGKKGEKHHLAKLTADQVRAIRNLPQSNVAIAKQFGVSRLAVWEIRTRRTWSHI